MKVVCAIVALCFVCIRVGLAQSADEQYVRIYQVIQEADRLNATGQGSAAAAKYLEAQDGLRRFQSVYPGWNDRVVNYRLNYITTKLAPLAALLTAPTNMVAQPSAMATNLSSTSAIPATSTAPAIPAFPPSAIADLQQQVAALQGELDRLQAENKRLAAKLREALSVQPAAVDPRELTKAEERVRFLEKENELLKVRMHTMATSGSATSLPAGSAELRAKIGEQNETIAALRAENEVLKKQSAEFQKNMAASAKPATASGDGGIERLNEELLALHKERALLKEALQEKDRQLASKPASSSDAERQIDTLRARVQVLEAKPIPYTKEELALLDKSAMALAYAAPARTTTTQPPPAEGAPRKVSKAIPPGAGPLVSAAERAFATRNYAEAESKYLDVLRQDEDNVATLANLASTQLELGRIDEAQRNVGKAIALDPDDHFSLYVLGRIRFRQDRLDEALDALSRSASANPEYAEAQNYLGIVLSEKGLRVPAEAALRKAIQLQPNHAAAHNNLAVVYATQRPPAFALARWHYRKAIDSGHPRNAELEKLLEQK